MTSFDLEEVLATEVPELPEPFEQNAGDTPTILFEALAEASDEDSPIPSDHQSFSPELSLDNVQDIHKHESLELPSEPTIIKNLVKDTITQSVKNDPTHSQINVEISGLNKLDKLDQLNALSKIDSLNEKLDALHDLNRLLQMHSEVFENLSHLNKLDRLSSLKQLEELKKLDKLDSIKELDNLKQLESLRSLEKVSEIEKLENLSELRALDHLKDLEKLGKLDYLKKLDELDQLEGLDKLKNLELLSKLDDVDFFHKIEKLDKLSIMNQKFHIIFLGQCLGFFLELLKFGVAAVLVLYLISTHIGQKLTTQALTAVGFGAPAQTNLGLMLLQGQIEEPKFAEIIANTRKKIKYDYQRAFSIDNNLTLAERVHLIKDSMDYEYVYQNVSIQEETLQALKQQIIYSKSNVIPKIEYDIAIAKNLAQTEEEKMLKELKAFFINGNYTEIIQKHKFSKSNLESLRLALIVATLELYIEDPQTLRQLIAL